MILQGGLPHTADLPRGFYMVSPSITFTQTISKIKRQGVIFIFIHTGGIFSAPLPPSLVRKEPPSYANYFFVPMFNQFD